MSPQRRKLARTSALQRRDYAPIFAALGDETRLYLLARLNTGERLSISQLTTNTAITRQAVSKHLQVLESVRLVRCHREGREARYELTPQSIVGLSEYLHKVAEQWDAALLRLKMFVETETS